MVRRFIRVVGIIVMLLLTLTVIAQAALVSTADAERPEDTLLVCLALVGGAVLLAGSVWMRKLRRMLP